MFRGGTVRKPVFSPLITTTTTTTIIIIFLLLIRKLKCDFLHITVRSAVEILSNKIRCMILSSLPF